MLDCDQSINNGERDFEQGKNNGKCLQCNQNAQLENFALDKHICVNKSYFEIVQQNFDVANCEVLNYVEING